MPRSIAFPGRLDLIKQIELLIDTQAVCLVHEYGVLPSAM